MVAMETKEILFHCLQHIKVLCLLLVGEMASYDVSIGLYSLVMNPVPLKKFILVVKKFQFICHKNFLFIEIDLT